ncbi:Uncharacterised protein [Candidatus Burarchaeum australiense]|nr:Uncharacterised protein [Candidatus Burarchaeum australiense]
MEMTFALAFVLTNLLEMLVAYFLLRKREGLLRILAVVLLCNLLTMPYVWFVFPALLRLPYFTVLMLSELFALFLEMIIYCSAFRNAGALRATLAAVAANLVSLLAGLALT